jgi:hypothetical protein
VLRPKDFSKHSPQFIISCSTEAASTAYACWQVPAHLQQLHWTAVLRQHAQQLSARQLLLPLAGQSQVLLVLGKFEDARFIHTFMRGACPGLAKQPGGAAELAESGSAAAGMVWQLPRCSLEFELTAGGSVASLDHRGLCLSTRQLLVSGQQGTGQRARYTLPEFHQYLVLQAQSQDGGSKAEVFRPDVPEQLVLVPSGRVVVQRAQPLAGSAEQGASISVRLSSECDASVKVFQYAVHARFAHLIAHCTTSRLQLASLFAASSTLLPEPGSGLTGAETAMQLVRQSWTTEPLDTLQQQHLEDTAGAGGFLAPALRLLCADVTASAALLQHLHVPEVGAGAAARRAGAATAAHTASSTSTSSGAHTSRRAGTGALDADAVSEYVVQARAAAPAGFPASPRQQLTADEEAWLMHTGPARVSTAVHGTPDWQRWGRFGSTTQLPEFPVPSDFVQRAEAALLALVQTPERPKQLPAFPLRVPASAVPVAQDMMHELEHS